MAEELMKDRELLDIRAYLLDLLDELNALEEKRKTILINKGVNTSLLVTLELITMNKDDIQLIIRYYWDDLEKLIAKLNSIDEIKSELQRINEDFDKMKEIKERMKG